MILRSAILFINSTNKGNRGHNDNAASLENQVLVLLGILLPRFSCLPLFAVAVLACREETYTVKIQQADSNDGADGSRWQTCWMFESGFCPKQGSDFLQIWIELPAKCQQPRCRSFALCKLDASFRALGIAKPSNLFSTSTQPTRTGHNLTNIICVLGCKMCDPTAYPYTLSQTSMQRREATWEAVRMCSSDSFVAMKMAERGIPDLDCKRRN